MGIRGLAAVVLLSSSCGGEDVVWIGGFPDSAARSALLALHHDGTLDAVAFALPTTAPIEPPLAIEDRSARIELMLFDDPVDELFGDEGVVMPGPDPLPMSRWLYARSLEGEEWQRIDEKSPELASFTYVDPRPDPCEDFTFETIPIDATDPLAELLHDPSGAEYAIVDEAPGMFRVEAHQAVPLEVVPNLSVVTATISRGRLWVVTSTGALMSGVIAGDRIELSPERSSALVEKARFMIPDPYGDGFLVMTRRGELIEIVSGQLIFTLPIVDTDDEGTLALVDGSVYFSLISSHVVGKWNGTSVEQIALPDGFGGGSVHLVPGIGILIGAVGGQIFRLVDGVPTYFAELPPSLDADSILPYRDGFVVGADFGKLFRWIPGGRLCESSGDIVEDLELGLVSADGFLFGPSSHKDRMRIGGPTPLTRVR